jgi:hypothetical protein
MVVEAREKSDAKVLLVFVFCKVGEVERGEGAAAGGKQCGHSSGRIWVHRTDLGPCTSQKCVKESCIKSAGRHSSRADVVQAHDEIHVEVGRVTSV